MSGPYLSLWNRSLSCFSLYSALAWMAAATFLYTGLFPWQVCALLVQFVSSRACWGLDVFTSILSELNPFCHLLSFPTVNSGHWHIAHQAVSEQGGMPGVARHAAASGRAAWAGAGSRACCGADARLGRGAQLEGHAIWGEFERLCTEGYRFPNSVTWVWGVPAIRKRKDTWIIKTISNNCESLIFSSLGTMRWFGACRNSRQTGSMKCYELKAKESISTLKIGCLGREGCLRKMRGPGS